MCSISLCIIQEQIKFLDIFFEYLLSENHMILLSIYLALSCTISMCLCSQQHFPSSNMASFFLTIPTRKKKKRFDCARPLVIYDKLINSLSLCDAVMCYYRTLATPGRPVFLHTIDVHNRIDIIDHLGESRSNQTASIYTLYI